MRHSKEFEVHCVRVFYYTVGIAGWLMQESYGMLGKLIINMNCIPRLIPKFNNIDKAESRVSIICSSFYSL